jgi:DNA-binding transcriptional LysR family regulator
MSRNPLRRYFRHGFFPQLVAFEACVRHGSVTRAAEELCLAQPTVSCLIRKLSDTLGGPVLATRNRRMEPTALGLEALVLCEELLPAIERFDRRLSGLRGADGIIEGPTVAKASHGAEPASQENPYP